MTSLRRVRLSPRAYRAITFVALVLLGAIIVTGGAVRATGSGLGCPEWPTCTDQRLAPQLFAASQGHATIEYLNRLVTGLVSAIVIVAVLGALVREPRRRDLTWLSLGLVAGVLGQIVLGGITVLTHLHPVAVQSHFLLSLAIVACAVVLHERAGTDDHDAVVAAPPRARRASGLAVAVLLPTIAVGTILTGTGPHGGDPEARRFALDPRAVAQVHGVLVETFTLTLLVALVVAWRAGVSRRALGRGSVALAVAIGQTVVGYVQYFTGVPALLVGVHIAGATLLWITVLRYHLALSSGAQLSAPTAERITSRISSP